MNFLQWLYNVTREEAIVILGRLEIIQEGDLNKTRSLIAELQRGHSLSKDDEAVLAHLLTRLESLEKRMSALAHRTQ